jgi:hypothetical protein
MNEPVHTSVPAVREYLTNAKKFGLHPLMHLFYFIHFGGAEVVGRWREEGKGQGLFGWQAAIPAALCARFINAESGKRLGAPMVRTGRGCHIRPLLPGAIHFYFYPADFYFHSLISTSTTSVYTHSNQVLPQCTAKFEPSSNNICGIRRGWL